MSFSVALPGTLLSALIHESLGKGSGSSEGLLYGAIRQAGRAQDEGSSSVHEETCLVSYAVARFYDWSGDVYENMVEPSATIVGWWIARRAPPVPTLRDAAVQASLQKCLHRPLVLLSISTNPLDVRYRFTRSLAPIPARPRVLKHDSIADVADFQPVAPWSAFRSKPDRDPLTAAFQADRDLLSELLDQLEAVEIEANDLEDALLRDTRGQSSSSQPTDDIVLVDAQ